MLTLPKKFLGAALLLLAASATHAQYVWIGANGTRQYSDRPPPPGTPAAKIIKQPGRSAADAATEEPAQPEAAAKPTDAKAPPTLAEREAAYRERTKAQAELESKQRLEADNKRRLAEHCASAREGQAQLDSGMRVARIGPDGQKTYMTDEEKAVRSQSVNRALAECRQAGG